MFLTDTYTVSILCNRDFRLEEEDPEFTYILHESISDDRFGMRIVGKEQLVKLIKNEPANKND